MRESSYPGSRNISVNQIQYEAYRVLQLVGSKFLLWSSLAGLFCTFIFSFLLVKKKVLDIVYYMLMPMYLPLSLQELALGQTWLDLGAIVQIFVKYPILDPMNLPYYSFCKIFLLNKFCELV